MKKKTFAGVVLLTVIGLVFIARFQSPKTPVTKVTPITLRYIQSGDFNNGGYLSSGTTFWATNHTSNSLQIILKAIEVKAGSNWVIQSQPTRTLAFQPRGHHSPLPHLKPHSAGYATLQLASLPEGTIWRLKVNAAKLLTGANEVAARIQRYPRQIQLRINTGDTNIPLNPLASNTYYTDDGIDVDSQEIVEE